ncbi:MAG: hypothetical protein WCO20_08625, partial [Holophagaceae bacterium]
MNLARPSSLKALMAALALLAVGLPAQAAPPRARVSVGATLPLTGSEARIGGFVKEGYELAFE